MTLARHLGRYLRPAVLIDTSTLVNASQRDFGTLSALRDLTEELLAIHPEFPAEGTPFESLVFEGQAMEYLRFFEESVLGVLSAGRVSMQTRFVNGKTTRTVESVTSYQWFMADDRYLQRFAPATLEYLNDFRRRFPK